jgi:hypothetical protein
MERAIRLGLVVGAALLLILTAGFFFRLAWATHLWPWADSRLSYLFVASILAAIAVPALWVGVTGEVCAAAAGALDLTVTYLGATAYLLHLYQGQGGTRLLVATIVGGAGFLSSTGIYLWSRRVPPRDPRPVPTLVLLSFLVFTLALVAVGIALIRQAPHIFPWPLDPRSSVLYGWIFLGAAVYFLHGALRPRWANACGQLLGFLAYDLILIGPFLQHFGAVKPEHRISLMIYTAVLLYSGAVAIFYCFVHRATRLRLPAVQRAGARASVRGRMS